MLLATLLLSGCGGRSGEFGEDDLPDLVFEPSEAPAGTQYEATMSGAGALEKEEGSARTIAALRKLGFRADYATVFLGKRLFLQAIAVLIRDDQGAAKGLVFLRGLVKREVPGATEVAVDAERWAFTGVSGIPTPSRATFLGWRRGNAVLLLTVAPSTPESARPFAARLDARSEG